MNHQQTLDEVDRLNQQQQQAALIMAIDGLKTELQNVVTELKHINDRLEDMAT